jgi:hypothetical protein
VLGLEDIGSNTDSAAFAAQGEPRQTATSAATQSQLANVAASRTQTSLIMSLSSIASLDILDKRGDRVHGPCIANATQRQGKG